MAPSKLFRSIAVVAAALSVVSASPIESRQINITADVDRKAGTINITDADIDLTKVKFDSNGKVDASSINVAINEVKAKRSGLSALTSALCAPEAVASPPAENTLVEVAVGTERTANWTALPNVGNALVSVSARAIRDGYFPGTITVDYEFLNTQSANVSYLWDAYYPAASQTNYTLLGEQNITISGPSLGYVSICINDSGASNLLVGITA